MDDGEKSSDTRDSPRRVFALNTQGFTENEVQMLCDRLTKKFGLKCWKKPTKNGFVVVISTESYELVMSLLDPSSIPSMRHKLPFGTTFLS